MPQLRAIPVSQRAAPAGMALSSTPEDERIVVSVYLKPDNVPAGSIQRGADPRAALRVARDAAHADDVHRLTTFAAANGLEVAEVDVARRLVKLGGSTTALALAFEAKLHLEYPL